MSKQYLYRIVRPLLYAWIKVKYNPTIIGKENIPKKGRCILAGNHTNNADGITLGATTFRTVRYVAKMELTSGIKGPFFKQLGLIPVNRKIHDKSVIPACLKCLEDEDLIGIFPEGTINRTDDVILPFKKGVIVMAIRSNSKIIPFAINGNYKKSKLKIIVGKPYFPKTDDVEKEIKVLEKKVISLLERIGD